MAKRIFYSVIAIFLSCFSPVSLAHNKHSIDTVLTYVRYGGGAEATPVVYETLCLIPENKTFVYLYESRQAYTDFYVKAINIGSFITLNDAIFLHNIVSENDNGILRKGNTDYCVFLGPPKYLVTQGDKLLPYYNSDPYDYPPGTQMKTAFKKVDTLEDGVLYDENITPLIVTKDYPKSLYTTKKGDTIIICVKYLSVNKSIEGYCRDEFRRNFKEGLPQESITHVLLVSREGELIESRISTERFWFSEWISREKVEYLEKLGESCFKMLKDEILRLGKDIETDSFAVSITVGYN